MMDILMAIGCVIVSFIATASIMAVMEYCIGRRE